MSAITWKETDREAILDQWGPVLRGDKFHGWWKGSSGIRNEDIDRIQRIAENILRRERTEREYAGRMKDVSTVVIFPGNDEMAASDEAFEGLRGNVVPAPRENTFVLVSKAFLNVFTPLTLLERRGDYSGTWDCVMDTREYLKTDWAVSGIDYKSLGFESLRLRGFWGNYRTWMAPHHYEFIREIEPEISHYLELM